MVRVFVSGEIHPPCVVLPGDVADAMFHVKHPDFVISALC